MGGKPLNGALSLFNCSIRIAWPDPTWIVVGLVTAALVFAPLWFITTMGKALKR